MTGKKDSGTRHTNPEMGAMVAIPEAFKAAFEQLDATFSQSFELKTDAAEIGFRTLQVFATFPDALAHKIKALDAAQINQLSKKILAINPAIRFHLTRENLVLVVSANAAMISEPQQWQRIADIINHASTLTPEAVTAPNPATDALSFPHDGREAFNRQHVMNSPFGKALRALGDVAFMDNFPVADSATGAIRHMHGFVIPDALKEKIMALSPEKQEQALGWSRQMKTYTIVREDGKMILATERSNATSLPQARWNAAVDTLNTVTGFLSPEQLSINRKAIEAGGTIEMPMVRPMPAPRRNTH
jgi:hypothetical protein